MLILSPNWISDQTYVTVRNVSLYAISISLISMETNPSLFFLDILNVEISDKDLKIKTFISDSPHILRRRVLGRSSFPDYQSHISTWLICSAAPTNDRDPEQMTGDLE